MIGLLSIVALGFLLGMRHATDPDHVIAVSTIVSRHRSIKHAAVIGGLWGVGHTLTILLVGGGIILFGWVILPRVSLSMEFSVGYMKKGWYLTSAPIVTANWMAPRGNVWTTPFGGGVGRIMRLGFQPVNISAQFYGNAVRPTGASSWAMKLQIAFLFPKKPEPK